MSKFAKLFDSPRYGQILVVISENDEGGLSLIHTFQVPDVGLCCLGMDFPPTEKGRGDAETAFDVLTLETLEEYIDTSELYGGEFELH
jgi:hypothetical protein